MRFLPWDAKRRHVHYVHHRTDGVNDVQPDHMAGEQLRAQIVKCYKRCTRGLTESTKAFSFSA